MVDLLGIYGAIYVVMLVFIQGEELKVMPA
jgi:hypothetical protein